MMDILQFKSGKINEDHKGTGENPEDGFSMDNLLSAMREHLFKREDSFRRLFGAERRCAADDDDGRPPRVSPDQDLSSLVDSESPYQVNCVSESDGSLQATPNQDIKNLYGNSKELECSESLTYQDVSDKPHGSDSSLSEWTNKSTTSAAFVNTISKERSSPSSQFISSPFYEELVENRPNGFHKHCSHHKETDASSLRSMPCKTFSHSCFDLGEKIDFPTENGYNLQRLAQYGEGLADEQEEPDYLLESILKNEKSRSLTTDSFTALKDGQFSNSETLEHLMLKESLPFQSQSRFRTKKEGVTPNCSEIENTYKYRDYEHRTRKYNSGHRNTCGDSPPDSAVDVDSASLQSSPSADAQTVTLWPVSGDVTSPVCQNGGFVNGVYIQQRQTHNMNKKAESMTGLMSTQCTDSGTHQHLEGANMSLGYPGQKDSDVDSGIAHSDNSHSHHGYRLNGCHDNSYSNHSYSATRESVSSRTGQENYRSYSVQKNSAPGHSVLNTSHVKHTLRTQQTRSQTPRSDRSRSGPLKADHSIQPVTTPTEQRRNYDMESWLLRGARPKKYSKESHRGHSSSKQNGRRTPGSPRDSPNARVHFLDETLEMDYLAETLELRGNAAESRSMYRADYSGDKESPRTTQSRSKSNLKKERLPRYTDPDINHAQLDSPAGMEEYYARRVLIEDDTNQGHPQGSEVKRSTKDLAASNLNSVSKQIDSGTFDSDQISTISESNTDTGSLVIGIREKKPWQTLAHSAAIDYWSSSCESLATIDSRKAKSHRFQIWKRNKGQYAPNDEMQKQEKEMSPQAKNVYIKRPHMRAKSASAENLYDKMPHPPSQPRSTPDPVRKRPSSASAKMKSADAGSRVKNEKLSGTMADDLIAERNKRVEELFKNYTGLDLSSAERSYQNEAAHVGRKYRSVSDLRSGSAEIDISVSKTENASENTHRRNQNMSNRGRLHHPSHSMDDIRVSKAKKNQTVEKNNLRNDSNPCIAAEYDDSIKQIATPPEVKRGNTSDLDKHRELSGSRTSLSNRVDSFKESAKQKFSKLRKAVSLERLNHGSQGNRENKDDAVRVGGKLKKSSSLRSLRNLFKKKDANSEQRNLNSATGSQGIKQYTEVAQKNAYPMCSTGELSQMGSPQHFGPTGRLCGINPDGTQQIELIKPPHGPIGFYIARGNKKYNHGVFISRLSGGHPGKCLLGLLGVGDEILEVNNLSVKKLSLEAVYDDMAQKPRILLKTLPFLARKDF